LPSNTTFPETMDFGGTMPIKARTVMDFPDPDSPTKPKVCPRSRVRSILLTAWTRPRGDGILTERSWMLRRGALLCRFRGRWLSSLMVQSPFKWCWQIDLVSNEGGIRVASFVHRSAGGGNPRQHCRTGWS